MARTQIMNPADPINIRDINNMFAELYLKETRTALIDGSRDFRGAVRVKMNGPHHAVFRDSSTPGIALFGVGANDATEFTAQMRIGNGVLQFTDSSGTYDVRTAKGTKKTTLYSGATALAPQDYMFSATAEHDFYTLLLRSNTNSAHYTNVAIYPNGYQYKFVNEYHVQKQLTCRVYSDRLTVTQYNGAWLLVNVHGYKIG
ncbi:MAG: hypothetical protein ACOYU3_10015 [Bacillota bacterium]